MRIFKKLNFQPDEILMRLFLLICFLVPALGFSQASFSMTEEVALVVNESPITASDINDRLHLVMSSSGLPNNQEVRANLMPQIIGVLVDEQIRVQEAERLKLEVNQTEINESFAKLAQSNNFTPEQFREILNRSGININTLEDQLRAQISWLKVVQTKLRPQIQISDIDVDNMLERLNNNLGKTEYLIAEILLPVDDPTQEGKVRQLAQDLSNEIRAGKVQFSRIAQQFSKAAGADQGGDLGWIQEGQLEPDLDAAVQMTEKGQITPPIRTLSGLHILFVRDVRVISQETLPSKMDVFNLLGQQRLESQARRYFLDLKSSAFVDNRLES